MLDAHGSLVPVPEPRDNLDRYLDSVLEQAARNALAEPSTEAAFIKVLREKGYRIEVAARNPLYEDGPMFVEPEQHIERGAE